MAGGLLMIEDPFFLFHSAVLGFRAWILQQVILHSNFTSGNLYEAKIFTKNNSSILKNHLRNPICFLLNLLFCNKEQNYKIGISLTPFWNIFTEKLLGQSSARLTFSLYFINRLERKTN